MTLKERIHADITAAMRSGETLRRDVLRMAQNAVDLAEKRDRRPYTDDEILGILTREVKTRRESIEAFRNGGRQDLADKEQAEIDIISAYLPTPLTPQELDALVAQALAETGATTPRDLGKVMGWISPRTRGRADGREVSGKVAQALAQANLAAHDAGPNSAGQAAAGQAAAGQASPGQAANPAAQQEQRG